MSANPSFPFETVFGGVGATDYTNLKLFGWYIYHKKRENNGRLPLTITPADFIQKLKDDTYNLKSKFGEASLNKAIQDFERLIGEHRLTADPKNVPAENLLYQFAKSLDDEGVLEDIARGNIVPNYRKALEETAPIRRGARTKEGEQRKEGTGVVEESTGERSAPEEATGISAFEGGVSLGGGVPTGLEAEIEGKTEDKTRTEIKTTGEGKEAPQESVSTEEKTTITEGRPSKKGEEEEREEPPRAKRAGVEAREAEGEYQPQQIVIPKMIGGVPTRMAGPQRGIKRVKDNAEGETEESATESEEAREQKARQEAQRISGRPVQEEQEAEKGGSGRPKKERPAIIRFLRGAGICTAAGTAGILGLGSTAKAETLCKAENLELIKTILEILIK